MLTDLQKKTIKTLLLAGQPYADAREQRQLEFTEADSEGFILRDEFEKIECPLYPHDFIKKEQKKNPKLTPEQIVSRYFKKYLVLMMGDDLLEPHIEIRAKKTKFRKTSNPIHYTERVRKNGNIDGKGLLKRRKGSAYRFRRTANTWKAIALLCAEAGVLDSFFCTPYHHDHPDKFEVLYSFYEHINAINHYWDDDSEDINKIKERKAHLREHTLAMFEKFGTEMLEKCARQYLNFFIQYLRDEDAFFKDLEKFYRRCKEADIRPSVSSQGLLLCENYRNFHLNDTRSVTDWLHQLHKLNRHALLEPLTETLWGDDEVMGVLEFLRQKHPKAYEEYLFYADKHAFKKSDKKFIELMQKKPEGSTKNKG